MESNIDKKMSKIVFLCCLFWFIAARAARLQLLHNCKQRDGEIRPGTGSRQQPGTVRMSAWILAGAGAGAGASAGQDTGGRMTDGSCAAHSIHQSPARAHSEHGTLSRHNYAILSARTAAVPPPAAAPRAAHPGDLAPDARRVWPPAAVRMSL